MKRASYGRNGGPVDREGPGVPQNGQNGPPTVETGVLLIGRGVAYRKTDETDLLRSKRGSCSSGGVWRTAKRDSTGYCSSPPSTSSSLHGLLFIQPPPRATPPATVQPPLHGHPSTVYCSSSPPHHGVLFNHPSMGTPPPSTVHPALNTPRGPVHPEATPPLTVHPTPPATLTVHPIDRLQLAAVAKESLDRVLSWNCHGRCSSERT